MELMHKLVDRILKDHKKEPLAQQVAIVAGEFNSLLNIHNELDDVFEKTGLTNMWSSCPCCESPVLVNFGQCPYCDTELGSVAKKKEEEKEEKPKGKGKGKGKPKAKPEPEPDEEEEEEVEEPEEDEEEVEEEDEDELPSEDEVSKMRTAGLKKLIEKIGLDIDPDEYDKVSDLRDAVNNAIDELAGEDEEETEEEEPEVEEEEEAFGDEEEAEEDEDEEDEEEEDEEPTDEEVDEFDLDDFEDDDDEVFED